MRTTHGPSLLQSAGYLRGHNKQMNNKTITIIYNNYLRNLREELLEEESTNATRNNNKITYITAKVEGIPARIMIYTCLLYTSRCV